jgi:hypothetical protein
LTIGAWAIVTLEGISPESTSMLAATTLAFRMYCLICRFTSQ